ncbi:MAG: hypothetical protein K6U87_07175 [Firmicutes bacterium]|nr:hypothetical protein [Bacillota bacterium]
MEESLDAYLARELGLEASGFGFVVEPATRFVPETAPEGTSGETVDE